MPNPMKRPVVQQNQGYRSNNQIASEAATLNTNPNIGVGQAGIMDFPAKGQVAPRMSNQTQGNINLSTLKGAAGDISATLPKKMGYKANAVADLAMGDTTGAVTNIAKNYVPGVSMASRAVDFGKRLGSGDATGALLEGAGAVVPVVPDLINAGRDIIRDVNQRSIENNNFNQRNREVRGSLQCRNTGIVDSSGSVFVNSEDTELLGKLGYVVKNYSRLEKTSEVLDLYSYIEKVAGVPKDVAKLIDSGKAFSAEYLKDMKYNIPKGYEVKGDLCCPVEKTEESFQQAGKTEKQSAERPGLWANIRAKRARGEKAAKPGDEDYPDKKQWNKLSKESALGAGEVIKLLPKQERISLIRAYRKLLERQDPTNKKAIRAVMGTNKGSAAPKVVAINGEPSLLHYRADRSVSGLKHPRAKGDPSFEAHVKNNTGGALSTTVDKELALRLGVSPYSAKVLGTYTTPLKELATNQRNKNNGAMVNNIWPKEREITQASGGNLLKAVPYEAHTSPSGSVSMRPIGKIAGSAAWQRSEGKNPEGGLNAKGRASYKKQTGGTLKAPVTESNPSGERAKRQNSFCSRMCGMKRKNTGSKGQSDPDSRINKSLRKWNCKCGEDHSSLFEKIACSVKEAKGRCWEGYEPVPGKEAYSEDSCRPKTDKKKEEKKAEADVPLKSSNIRAVGHDKKSKELDVAFHSGGEYRYNDVPRSVYSRLLRAKSHGKFFHKHIKKDNKYPYEKVAEYKWHNSKDLHRDVTNGRHYPFSFLTGEAKELMDAVKNRDMANFKEEIGDTTYAAQMLAAQATGLNHPVYADLSKFYNREKVWKDMFKSKGSTYHPKHMEGGSNFAKPSKIIKAFASAGINISQREAERLANKHTDGKMEKEAGFSSPKNKISVSSQGLLPGMSEQLGKQSFNHAENAFSRGRISKALRDSILSGQRAEELRPAFEKMLEHIRNIR